MKGAPRRPTSVTTVIPALDEEGSIGAVLEAIPRDFFGEVIVVDGGSKDGTAAIAASLGARVIQESRRGYGRACARGSAESRGEVVVFLDADGANDPREIPALVAPIANGKADLVLGSRFKGTIAPGAMPWHQRFGNRFSAFLIRLLYGLPLSDLGPFRAVRRVLLDELSIEDLTYGWPTEMIVKAVRKGWRIVEIPVSCRVRLGGRSKISGTLRGTLLATLHIVGTILRNARGRPKRGARDVPVVVIMAKQPREGGTKTRLCPPLTPGEAADLYRALLRDTVSLVQGLPGMRLAIAVSPPGVVEELRPIAPRGTRMLPVEGGDIGECLSAATASLFSKGYTRVIALNSDGPTLPAAHITRAAALLRENEVVLGPNDDGGYYLIGLRRPRPELFRGIAWSSDRVTSQTRERAGMLGLTVALLPPWYDIDTAADLRRLGAELISLPPAALRYSRRFFARWRAPDDPDEAPRNGTADKEKSR